jgi:vancomycin resistance protein YoaR
MAEPTQVMELPQHSARGRGRPPRRRWRWVIALVPVLLVVALVVAWALDTSSGAVDRNVRVESTDVGGVTEDELPARIAEVAERYASRPVDIVTRDRTYSTTAGEIGLTVDERATIAEVLAVGDDTPLFARPFEWAVSLFSTHDVAPSLRVDEATAAVTMTDLEGNDRIPPVEPSVELTDAGFEVVPGQTGQGIDHREVVSRLVSAAEDAEGDLITVEVEPRRIRPRGSDDDAAEAAARAEQLTSEPLELRTDAGSSTVPVDELRQWVVLATSDDGAVQVDLNRKKVVRSLRDQFTDIESQARSASFEVADGQVRIVPAVLGQRCCADTSADRIINALQNDRRRVRLDLVVDEPELTTEEAEELGIVEEIGSPDAFGPTTQHACCEGRVQNIHRISDIVRGQVILPGETFSVNGFVGERTIDKGFVEAGVIYDGEYTTDVGGGVSQFATTLFNAALFAGLELTEYQSHSIYISRYPRGHEATISFPAPDLKITNETPYGVLLWPEYTDTSVTVRMYSTRHAAVELGEPTASPSGRCTRWTTPRTRTYPDGSVEQDSVYALYRPGEGIDC